MDRICDTLRNSVSEGLHPEGGTHAGTFLEENTRGEVYDHIPRVRPHAGVGKEDKEKETAKSYELTATPISHPPALLAGRI